MTRRAPWFVLYNLRVGRSKERVVREILAILTSHVPAILILVEAIGYGDLPDYPGYERIQDRSRPSRANVVIYARTGLVKWFRWHDMTKGWPRTEHPGTHEPRSWLELRLVGILGAQVLAGHNPPKGEGMEDARWESINAVTLLMAPWKRKGWRNRAKVWRHAARLRPRAAFADWNNHPGESGPGQHLLSLRINGEVHGATIDAAVTRRADAEDPDTFKTAGKTALKTDHPWGAFKVRLRWRPAFRRLRRR